MKRLIKQIDDDSDYGDKDNCDDDNGDDDDTSDFCDDGEDDEDFTCRQCFNRTSTTHYQISMAQTLTMAIMMIMLFNVHVVNEDERL